LRLRRSTVVLVVVVGLLGVSSVAVAEHEDFHPEDTSFSFGYDPADHFLAINISPLDVGECGIENRTLSGAYGEEVDGIYEVVLGGYEICVVSGVVVAGPNGQVNHGQFMKAAKSLFDLKGHGCLVRELAKSEIGRTDETRVRTSDVEPIDIGEDDNFSFASFDVDCSRGDEAKTKKGRPESPGKSADAPGRDK